MRVDVTIWIIREEAGSGDVFAGLIDIDVVGLLEVVGNGSEVVGMTGGGDVDFDYPLEAVAGWGAKQ